MENTNITIGTIGTAKVGRNEVTVKVVAIEGNSYLVESLASHRQFKTQHLIPQVILRQPEALEAKTEPEAPQGAVQQAKGEKERKVTLLDRAAELLAEEGGALTCNEIIEKLKSKGFSLNGATPKQTLYSAFFRDIEKNGKESRFRKSTERKAAFELNIKG